MSKRKQKNKIRKSTKYSFIIIAIFLLLFSLTNLSNEFSNETMKTTNKEIYTYSNNFKYDYNVTLSKNKYIKQPKESDSKLVFVTDLIDTINLDLVYDYIADTNSDLTYDYTITGVTKAVYTKDGEEQKILDEQELLFEGKAQEVNSDKINITQNLKLNLKEKNDLLNEFKQKMGMSIDAKYIITLNVNVSTEVEGQQVNSNYSPTIQLDLAEKTTDITGANNLSESQYLSKQYQVNTTKNKIAIIRDFIFLAIALLLLKYVSQFRTANRVKDEFRQELNRLLKICQDKIVQVSDKPINDGENIVRVKDFGEIVKVSEELFKPILYYFDIEKQEAWFSVMTGSVIYRYILKD